MANNYLSNKEIQILTNGEGPIGAGLTGPTGSICISLTEPGLWFHTVGGSSMAWEKAALGDYLPLAGGIMTGDILMGATAGDTGIALQFNHLDPSDISTIESDDDNLLIGGYAVRLHSGDGINLDISDGVYVSGGARGMSFQDGVNYGQFQWPTLTGGRNVDFQDASGTVAFLSDIPSVAGYLPLAGGTMAGNINMAAEKITFDFGDASPWEVYDAGGDEFHIDGAEEGNWNVNIGPDAKLIFGESATKLRVYYNTNEISINVQSSDSTIKYHNAAGSTFTGSLGSVVLTADRDYDLPDASGTIALKQKNIIANISSGGGNGLGQATGATTEAYGFNDTTPGYPTGWMHVPSKTYYSAGGTFTVAIQGLINSAIPMVNAISSNERLNLKGSIVAEVPGTNATEDFYIAYAIIPICIGATTTPQTVSWEGVQTITTTAVSGGDVRDYVGCFDFDINGPIGATQALLLGYASANTINSWSPRWVLSVQD